MEVPAAEANDVVPEVLTTAPNIAVSPVHQTEEARSMSLAEQTATDLARG